MMIGRKLATETSMLRTPKTRPRTSSGQVLLELGLGRDRDDGVGDAGEERDGDDDRQERGHERQVDAASGRRRRSGTG